MKNSWWVPCSVLQIAAFVAACGGQAIDVGSNGSGAAPSTSASQSLPPGDPLPVWPDPTTCQPGPTTVSGTWTGYVQGTRPSGVPNTDFKITLGGADGALCGTLLFGEAMDFAPPTDPKAGYPQGVVVGLAGLERTVYVGYTYLVSGTRSARRLQLHFSWLQRWREWCEIQTPYFDSNTGWNCAPNISGMSDGTTCKGVTDSGEAYTSSCDQLFACQGHNTCACNQQGCAANSNQLFDFDLALNDTTDSAQGDFDGSTAILTKN